MVTVRSVLFDMDGVLYAYDFENRLNLLESALGVPAETIKREIFLSGFDDAHDDGEMNTEDYIAGISERLGVPVRLGQWVAARKWAMAPEPAVIDLARALAAKVEIALLTNNGPMLLENLPELAPELPDIFKDRLFVSGVHGFNKERAEDFTCFLAHLGWQPESTLFIDDSQRYIDEANKAGLLTHHFDGVDGLRARLASLGL